MFMPEGTSPEIPNKDINMTPESKPDIWNTPITRRTALKVGVAAGAAVILGKDPAPTQASQELPVVEPLKSKEQMSPEEAKARSVRANCIDLVPQVQAIDSVAANFAYKNASDEINEWEEANKCLETGQYEAAKAIFDEVRLRLLSLGAVHILNQTLEKQQLAYSWDDIQKGMDHVLEIGGTPLSEFRNYLADKTPIENKIERYFWRGIPTNKDGKVVPIYSQQTYVENINELASMVGGFSGKDPEVIMGAFLIAPSEKPKYPDVSGHTKYIYDWAEMPGNKLRGHQFDTGPIDWIKKFFRIPIEERKIVYVRASEISPTFS